MRSDTKPVASRFARAILITTLLPPLMVMALGSMAHEARAGDDSAAAYEFARTRNNLVRVDTSNGRVWFAAMTGLSGWIQIGTEPADKGKPNRPGRYTITSVGSRSNVTVVGPKAKQEVYLALMDHATGRVFLGQVAAGKKWQKIAEPAEGAPES